MKFFPLTICKSTDRIGGLAKTIEFDVPSELAETFAWQAGQHITVRIDVNGEEVRRSYTISASPDTGENLQITVKRVKGGMVSNYINDTLVTGTVVDVMPPYGSFILEPQQNVQRTHYFFGAGSGITPMYAMINTILVSEPNSIGHLLFANRDDTNILFKDELSRLEDVSQNHFTVSHVLSKPRWLSNFPHWADGKIDKVMIEKFISEHPPYAQDTQYYICGPGSMNQELKQALMELDVPSDRIHLESFGNSLNQKSNEANNNITGMAATLSVELSSEQHKIAVAENQTILNAMREAGLDAPFSCQSGVCGACKAKINNGNILMKVRVALDDEDIAKGDILTCQALCQTKRVSINIK